MQQLENADADVVCLEELTDYWTYFKPEMQSRGYDSVFVKRPSVNPSTWSGKRKQDGCGIFFKSTQFSLLDCDSINFQDNHDRVALFALLKHKPSDHVMLVANTHIWWNAAYVNEFYMDTILFIAHRKPDHQLRQLKELHDEIKRLVHEHCGNIKQIPIVICGDYNNGPSSELYHYMRTSFMIEENMKFRSAYDQYTRLMDKPSPDNHPYVVVDVNQQEESFGQFEPPHTTVNYRRCWTIDYIWYNEKYLRPIRIWKIPSESELRQEEGPPGWLTVMMAEDSSGRLPAGRRGNHNGIPNSIQGSDHVPIMAEFQFLFTK